MTKAKTKTKAEEPIQRPLVPVILAPWLPLDHPHRPIVENALGAVGVCEVPLGSNRSPEIDEWNRQAKAPKGSYWCASFAAACWRDANLETPEYPAGVDEWRAWAKATGRWSARALVGSVVIYGTLADANHNGIIVRTDGLLLSVEGNTSIGAHDRNGVVVALKSVREDRVLGYVHPNPIAR